MTNLISLAERVERLAGPCREVDCLIWIEVGNELGFDDPQQKWRLRRPLQPRICVMGRWLGSALEKYPEDVAGVALNWRVPEFTASIDAAMTLVPKGMILRRYMASRFVPHSCEVGLDYAHGGWVGNSDHSFALALLSACLRSLARMKEEEL